MGNRRFKAVILFYTVIIVGSITTASSFASEFVGSTPFAPAPTPPTNQFNEVHAGDLEGVYYGRTTWADYDRDGDMDVFITGRNSSNSRVSKLYQNTGSGFTEVFAGTFTDCFNSYADWGDYNNDGYVDLFLVGNGGSRIAKLYENNAGTGFTEVYAGTFGASHLGQCKFVDYNNDGLLDVSITGYSNNGPKTRLYENSGSGFSEVFSGTFESISSSSLDWGDYDNDGDMDLALIGSGSSRIAKVYQNNGTSFSEVYSGVFLGVYRGDVKWHDYNDDGRLDLTISGSSSTSGRITRLYENTGSTFTEVFAGTFLGLWYCGIDWGDYDNDGDSDLLISGNSSVGKVTKVYQNNGSSFTEVLSGQLPGADQASAQFGDYDGDNDLDIAILGRNSSNQPFASIYENGTTTSNVTPGVPSGLTVSFDYPKVILSWDPASDTETSTDGLMYNVRLGTTAGANDLVSHLSLSSGRRLVAGFGNANIDTMFVIDSLPSATYYWSVQTIDNGQNASAFATEDDFFVSAPPTVTTDAVATITAATATVSCNVTSDGGGTVTARGVVWGTTNTPTLSSNSGFSVDGSGTGAYTGNVSGLTQNTSYYVRAYATNASGTSYGTALLFTSDELYQIKTSNTIDSLYNGDLAWVDFDNDGDLDISITGTNGTSYYTKFYQNSSGSFTEVYAGTVPGVINSSIDWGDYDNDGDLDLLLTGNTGSTRITRVYQNTGSGFSQVTTSMQGFHLSEGIWVDVDNDGLLDIVVVGYGSSGQDGVIYQNTGSGFTEIYSNQLVDVLYADVAFGDIDQDGDMDLMVCGLNNTTPVTKLYENTGSGFTEILSGTFTGVYRGELVFGDYDNDGDQDIFVTGNSSSSSTDAPFARLYRNNGSNSFAQVLPGTFEGVFYSSADFADVDNDGDLDFIVTGRNTSGSTSTIMYQNNISTFSQVYSNQFETLYQSAVKFGDYDGDDDMDILIMGDVNSSSEFSAIYDNTGGFTDMHPSSPTTLVTPNPFDEMTLSWSGANDTETAQAALTYNVRIGTSSGGVDIVSNTGNTNGVLKYTDRGNAHSESFNIKSLDPGTYYWAVQSIDNGYKGSTWSTEQSFTIPDGIIWNGTAWSNVSGPTSATSAVDVFIYSGDTAFITVDAQTNGLTVNTGAILKINSGVSITINGNLVNDGTIVIEDDASLVQVSGSTISGSGNAIVKRIGGTSALSYQIWSSPVSGEALLDVFPTSNLYDVYAFEPGVQNWRYDFASTTPTNGHANSPYTFDNSDMMTGADGIFDVGMGYYAVGNPTSKRVFEGPLNNEVINIPIVSTSLGNNSNWAGDDWNLVGNPFPSAISANLFWQENAINNSRISNAIYYWEDDNSEGNGYDQDADFATWNASGGTAATGGGPGSIPPGYISSCQGFWVKSDVSTNIVFNNNMRVAGFNDQFFKQENNTEWQRLWLNLTNEDNHFNQMLLAFNDNTTSGYDKAYDAQKLEGNANLSFASVMDNKNFAIQANPLLGEDDKIIELYIRSNTPGLHYIGIEQFENLSEYDIILEDKLTGKSTNLHNAFHTVYLNDNNPQTGRFYITFKKKEEVTDPTTSVNENELSNFVYYTTEDYFWIESNNFNNTINSVTLYTLDGKAIHNNTNVNNIKYSVGKNDLPKGVYLLNVTLNSGETKTIKILN